MQLLQDLNQSNRGNINNVRHEASRHLRTRRNILKLKSMNLNLTMK